MELTQAVPYCRSSYLLRNNLIFVKLCQKLKGEINQMSEMNLEGKAQSTTDFVEGPNSSDAVEFPSLFLQRTLALGHHSRPEELHHATLHRRLSLI